MASLPVRKYVKVWVKRRKNRIRADGSRRVSYTLQWVEFGQERFLSLGPHATLAYSKEAARQKEAELNSFERKSALDPITWKEFEKRYLSTFYPGHDLSLTERKTAAKIWGKSFASMRSERLALANFGRLIAPAFVHEVTTADRESFVTSRLAEVGSPVSVDTDLRVLRAVFNVAIEWKHCPENTNPFAGRGRSTVGIRRRREKEREQASRERHYGLDQVRAILRQARKEAKDISTWRLYALIAFHAYTGCRFGEAIHLEWQDIDFERGVAWLYFKTENDLKTEGSQAPFGLPDELLDVLREWAKQSSNTGWVFPNERGKPWKTGGPGFRPLDQLRKLGIRAKVSGATFKKFRHAFATLGKGAFGLSAEQVRAQLRHTTTDTQRHYSHDDVASLRESARKVSFA